MNYRLSFDVRGRFDANVEAGSFPEAVSLVTRALKGWGEPPTVRVIDYEFMFGSDDAEHSYDAEDFSRASAVGR